MKRRETISVRIIKWFYGIPDTLDEYTRQEIDRIGSNAFIFLWLYSFVSNLALFWVALGISKMTLIITLVLNQILSLLVAFGYVKIAMARKKLFAAEYAAKYAGHVIRWTIFQGIKAVVFFTPLMYYWNFILICGFKHQSVTTFLYTLNYPVEALMYGVGFSLFVLLGQLDWIKYHREK